MRVVARQEHLAGQRRRAIVAATIQVIAADGLSATTIERVADKAGVSPGTVSFHFQRKDLLLLAALDAVVAEFENARARAIAGAGPSAAAALDALVVASFDPRVSRPDKVAVWYAFWGEANARRTYLARVGRSEQGYLADITGLVSRLIAEGGYDGLDADAVATGLAGLLEWQWQEILVAGRAFDRAGAIRLARSYLGGIFRHHFR
ncbi:MAG: TetR family transcriptional regulator [Hyphomicrobiaceae bacterium]